MTNGAELQQSTAALIDLQRHPRNVRLHPLRNLDAIRASLTRFGQTAPLLLASDGTTIIKGNGTFEAMQSLGWQECRVIVTQLDGAEAEAYAIADNQAGDLSAFDMPALSDSLKSLGELSPDLTACLGFDAAELADLTAIDPEPAQEPPAVPDDKHGANTAMTRSSLPHRFWKRSKLLRGGKRGILDFGCGKERHECQRYDPFHSPDTTPIENGRQYQTVMCNYVLNVLPDHLSIQVAALVARLVKPGGHALFAIRSDVAEDTATQTHHTADEWLALLGRFFKVEPLDSGGAFYAFRCVPR